MALAQRGGGRLFSGHAEKKGVADPLTKKGEKGGGELAFEGRRGSGKSHFLPSEKGRRGRGAQTVLLGQAERKKERSVVSLKREGRREE